MEDKSEPKEAPKNPPPTKKEQLPEESEYVILEMQGRRRSGSYIDPTEAHDFWTTHKGSYIQFRTWEDDRSSSLRQLKALLSFLCDSLLIAMSHVNSSNQNLMAYFNLIESNTKEFGKRMGKTANSVDPIIDYHGVVGVPLSELFKKLKSTDNEFVNSLKQLCVQIEQVIGDIRVMTISYAKALATFKEARPMFQQVFI